MNTTAAQTYISTIVFLDIVSYSKASNRNQIRLKAELNDAINYALDRNDRSGLILTDTGDGAALGFLWNPEAALQFARRFQSWLHSSGVTWQVRIGLHLGPITVSEDLNGHRNMVGDGINASQRVMSFANPGQILVSKGYHDAVVQLDHDHAKFFSQPREYPDKHGRVHFCQEFLPSPDRSTQAPQRESPTTHTDSRGQSSEGAHTNLPIAKYLVGAVIASLAGILIWALTPFGETQKPPETSATTSLPSSVTAPEESAATKSQLNTPTNSSEAGTTSPVKIDKKLQTPPNSKTKETLQTGATPATATPGASSTELLKKADTAGRIDGTRSADCPHCNCADLLTKLSMGTEPLTQQQKAFLRENCH